MRFGLRTRAAEGTRRLRSTVSKSSISDLAATADKGRPAFGTRDQLFRGHARQPATLTRQHGIRELFRPANPQSALASHVLPVLLIAPRSQRMANWRPPPTITCPRRHPGRRPFQENG